MKQYLWKLAGADYFILQKSGKESQMLFYTVGLSYTIVYFITFISFFGLFWGVFHYFMVALMGAVVFSFIIGNIYRVILISLEPQTLPVKPEKGSMFFAYFVRIVTVLLFALFISKCFETMLLGHLVDNKIRSSLIEKYGLLNFNRFNTSEMFVEHMKVLSIEYPLVWIITAIIIGIFLYPVFIRHKAKGNRQYYDLKTKIDKYIVTKEYEKFLEVRDLLYVKIYEAYNNRKMKFKGHKKRYQDEPFNTIKTPKKQADFKTIDFINLEEWQ